MPHVVFWNNLGMFGSLNATDIGEKTNLTSLWISVPGVSSPDVT